MMAFVGSMALARAERIGYKRAEENTSENGACLLF